jgi:hypothetical protein
MELEGWTNDRLVPERLARLNKSEWVYGIPNASVVMASFLHGGAHGPAIHLFRLERLIRQPGPTHRDRRDRAPFAP